MEDQPPLNGRSFLDHEIYGNDRFEHNQEPYQTKAPPKRRVYTNLSTAHSIITADSASNSSKVNLSFEDSSPKEYDNEIRSLPLKLASSRVTPSKPPQSPLPAIPAAVYLRSPHNLSDREVGELGHDQVESSDFSNTRPPKINFSVDATDPATGGSPRFESIRSIFWGKSIRSPGQLLMKSISKSPAARKYESLEDERSETRPKTTRYKADSNQRTQDSREGFDSSDHALASQLGSPSSRSRRTMNQQEPLEQSLTHSQGIPATASAFGTTERMEADTYDLENLHCDLGGLERPKYHGASPERQSALLVQDESTVSRIVSHYEEEEEEDELAYSSESDNEHILENISFAGDGTFFHPVRYHRERSGLFIIKDQNQTNELSDPEEFEVKHLDSKDAVYQASASQSFPQRMVVNDGDDVFVDDGHNFCGDYSPGSAPELSLPALPSQKCTTIENNLNEVAGSSSYGNTRQLLNLTDAVETRSQVVATDDESMSAVGEQDVIHSTNPYRRVSNGTYQQFSSDAAIGVFQQAPTEADVASPLHNGVKREVECKTPDFDFGRDISVALRRQSGVANSDDSFSIVDVARSVYSDSDADSIDLVETWKPIINMPGGIDAAVNGTNNFYDAQAVEALPQGNALRRGKNDPLAGIWTGSQRRNRLKIPIIRNAGEHIAVNNDVVFEVGGVDPSVGEIVEDDDRNDWVTVQSEAESCAASSWGRLGADAGSSIADVSNDGDALSLRDPIHHISSRERILEHPAPFGFSGNLRERQVLGRGILGANHQVLLPSYAPIRTNGGFPLNSTRSPHLEQGLTSFTHGNQSFLLQNSRNPFSTTPPDISKAWDTTDPSSTMSDRRGKYEATSSEVSTSENDRARMEEGSGFYNGNHLTPIQVSTQTHMGNSAGNNNQNILNDYSERHVQSLGSVKGFGNIDVSTTKPDSKHPNTTYMQAEQYEANPGRYHLNNEGSSSSYAQRNHDIDIELQQLNQLAASRTPVSPLRVSPGNFYSRLRKPSSSKGPKAIRTIISAPRPFLLGLADTDSSTHLNPGETDAEGDRSFQSSINGDTIHTIDSVIGSSARSGVNRSQRPNSNHFACRSPNAPLSSEWDCLYTQEQRDKFEIARQARIAREIEEAGGSGSYRGDSIRILDEAPRLIPNHTEEVTEEMERRVKRACILVMLVCSIPCPILLFLYWGGAFDQVAQSLSAGQITEVKWKKAALTIGIILVAAVFISIAIVIPLEVYHVGRH